MLPLTAKVPPEIKVLVEIIRQGNTRDVVKALNSGASPNAKGEDGNSLLHEAVSYARPAIVRVLLDHGADPRAKGNEWLVPVAVNKEDLDSLRYLVDAGAYINRPPGYELAWDDPLCSAVQYERRDIVLLLLNSGADPKGRGLFNETALHRAALVGNLWAVNTLLERGADVNAADDLGKTALMEACHRGYCDVASVLIERGADPLQKDKRNRPATSFIVGHPSDPAVQKLRRCCGATDEEHPPGT